jgi:CTP:phosphocholine cytidylyltransferase-like protein
MNIIILADKYQKRMKSKGCVGLIRCNKLNLIETQMKYLKAKFKNANIVYVYGFDGKKLLSYLTKNSLISNDLSLIYNEAYDKFNNAYSLSLAKEYLNDDCLILFGDNPIGARIFNKFNAETLSQIFIAPQLRNRIGCIIQENRIENICFDLDNYLYDIYYLKQNDAMLLKEMLDDDSIKNYFVFELINQLISKNIPFQPFILDKKFILEKIS